MEISRDVSPEIGRVLMQLLADRRSKDKYTPAEVHKDQLRRIAPYYKYRQCNFSSPAPELLEELLKHQDADGERCAYCKVLLGRVKPRCSSCHTKSYCNAACQKKDWPDHKRSCTQQG